MGNTNLNKEKEKNSSQDKGRKKLEEFKEKYEEQRKKHNLPSYEEMNAYFDIEVMYKQETDLFLKYIRRRMTEKANAYLRFVEVFLNPSQAPLFLMILGKNIDEGGRKAINELYVMLGKIELVHLRLEVKSSEKEEIESIKEIFKSWKEMESKMLLLSKIFEDNWEKKVEGNNKTYFG